MLYIEKLKQYDNEVKNAVDKLFLKAFNNQTDENDLLLVIIHGFYNQNVSNNPRLPKFSPYVFGLGDEGLMDISQYDFYDSYRRSALIEGDATKYKEYLKSKKNWDLEQGIVTQMELMVYLKFWESDYILKQFYNLCRLIHGESYDWHKKLGNSRKKLIEDEIKNKTKKIVPKFFELIDKTYVRQIRNAIAHSQFRIAGDNLNLFNYDPYLGFDKKNILIEEWEIIFHKTILLYHHMLNNINLYDNHYCELAKDKHFGRCLRINKKDGDVCYEWLRFESDIKRWIWYKTYSQHYIKSFHII